MVFLHVYVQFFKFLFEEFLKNFQKLQLKFWKVWNVSLSQKYYFFTAWSINVKRFS